MAKYGRKASDKVASAMRRRKRGTLKSGGSGRRVRSRKQAIAIGLSEARREGGKVPPRRSSRKRRTSSAASRSSGAGSRKSSTASRSRKTTRKTRKSARQSRKR